MAASNSLLGYAVKTAITCSILALSLAASSVLAQTVFKSTMPDGKVVYGEKAAPGAAKVETIEPPPPKTGVGGLTPEEKARAAQLAKDLANPGKTAAPAPDRAAEARKLVQQAEAAREAGKEPLPGERQGIAGGGSRLTEAYFVRQKSLEEAVINARKRAAETQR